MTTKTRPSAFQIVRDAYVASQRTDIDFTLVVEDGTAVALFDSSAELHISDEWEDGVHIGYSWCTWNRVLTEEGLLVHGEDCWDEGGSDSVLEARNHVAEWLGWR